MWENKSSLIYEPRANACSPQAIPPGSSRFPCYSESNPCGSGIIQFNSLNAPINVGPLSFEYDQNGRPVKVHGNTSTMDLTYDSRGNILTVTNALFSGRNIIYAYDPNGRRIGKITYTGKYRLGTNAEVVKYGYEDGRLTKVITHQQKYGEIVNLTELTFKYFSTQRSPYEVSYLAGGVSEDYRVVTNQIGSPVALVSKSDASKVSYKIHSPYGRTDFEHNVHGFNLHLDYAGGIMDYDTGLVNFWHRDYNPATMRWLQPDPIGFAGGSADVYAYVGNDPVNYIDTGGLRREPAGWKHDGPGFASFWDRPWSSMVNYAMDSAGAVYDFGKSFFELRQANKAHNIINTDKYYHCLANCRGTSRGDGGYSTSLGLSEFREWFDYNLKGDSAEACNQDRAANSTGRIGAGSGSCSSVCSGLRPPTLP